MLHPKMWSVCHNSAPTRPFAIWEDADSALFSISFDEYFRRHVDATIDAKEVLLQPNIEDVRVLHNDELFEERRIGLED